MWRNDRSHYFTSLMTYINSIGMHTSSVGNHSLCYVAFLVRDAMQCKVINRIILIFFYLPLWYTYNGKRKEPLKINILLMSFKRGINAVQINAHLFLVIRNGRKNLNCPISKIFFHFILIHLTAFTLFVIKNT